MRNNVGLRKALLCTAMYRTARLLIRKFEQRDKKPLADLFSSSKAMEFVGPRRPMTEDETSVWLDHQLDLQQIRLTRFAVELIAIGELVGVCGYQFIDDEWDFGFYFRQAFWGHGYATEACVCLLEKAGELLRGDSFVVFIAEDNVASQKVMNRCGYTPTRQTTKDGEPGSHFTAA
jgi:[ribosomal protein S5]-alanine N-acetyltransferase